MEIQDIIWLDVFVEKIWRKHRVPIEEVEETLYGSPEIRFIEKGDVKGENVYALWEEVELEDTLSLFLSERQMIAHWSLAQGI